MRVALATNFISPYRVPLYTALDGTPCWDFKVFTSCDMEFDRQWDSPSNFPFLCKKSLNISYKRTVIHTHPTNFRDVRQIHLPVGLWFDLWSYRPDVVISSEMGARSLIAAIYVLIARKRLILYFEGTKHTERDINWKQRVLRNILCRFAHAFTCGGSESVSYVESLGVDPKKIFDVKLALDMTPFLESFQVSRRLSIRQKLGISGLCYLHVGGLIPRKGLDYLIKTWKIFCMKNNKEATLILVGDGVQKESLINLVNSLGLCNVKFIGFVNPEDLPAIYKASDIFVFPTLEDCWGLVVNEAMASGLPVICSKYAGCADDLIVDGQNGWIIDPLNINDIVQKLQYAWDAREKKEVMGKAGQELISRINTCRMTDGFIRSVEYVFLNNRKFQT